MARTKTLAELASLPTPVGKSPAERDALYGLSVTDSRGVVLALLVSIAHDYRDLLRVLHRQAGTPLESAIYADRITRTEEALKQATGTSE